jgi:hypothetical protein
MKHGVKPTVAQRKLLDKWKLKSEDWLVVKDEPSKITLVHRHFDNVQKIIPKGVREDGRYMDQNDGQYV